MVVILVAPFEILNGPSFNLGERIDLDDALARDLIHRGIAKQESVMPIPSSKTLDAPTAHKMIATTKAKKGAHS